MIKNLIKLAEHLDRKGLHKEADYVDWIIKSSSAKINLSAKEELKEHLVGKMDIGKDIVMPGKRKAAIESAKSAITISTYEKDVGFDKTMYLEIKLDEEEIYRKLYAILVADLKSDTKEIIKKIIGFNNIESFSYNDKEMKYYGFKIINS